MKTSLINEPEDRQRAVFKVDPEASLSVFAAILRVERERLQPSHKLVEPRE